MPAGKSQVIRRVDPVHYRVRIVVARDVDAEDADGPFVAVETKSLF